MRTRTVGTLTLVLLVAAGLAACSSSPSTPAAGPTTASVVSPGGGAATMKAVVSIQGFAFRPDPVAVLVGGTVTWTNKDSVAHTVTFDAGSLTSSKNLDSGATFTASFPKAGSYTYHCSIHSSMQGTVTVS